MPLTSILFALTSLTACKNGDSSSLYSQTDQGMFVHSLPSPVTYVDFDQTFEDSCLPLTTESESPNADLVVGLSELQAPHGLWVSTEELESAPLPSEGLDHTDVCTTKEAVLEDKFSSISSFKPTHAQDRAKQPLPEEFSILTNTGAVVIFTPIQHAVGAYDRVVYAWAKYEKL